MTWEMFYLICFGLGLALSVLSFAGTFGHLGGAAGVHGHLGVGHLGSHVPGHASAHIPSEHSDSSSAVSWLNGFTVTAFLCWFGGMGFLLTHNRSFAVPVILLLATASGLAAGAVIFFFLVRVLLPHEHELCRDETAMPGVVGRVSSAIRPDGVGEILYTQLGARRSSPARSETGEALERGAEVYVLRYENGIAYVRRWDDFEHGN